jgi:hypothetical protein
MSLALLLALELSQARPPRLTPRPTRPMSSEELRELIRNQSDAELDAAIRREFEASERRLRELGVSEPTRESMLEEWRREQSP